VFTLGGIVLKVICERSLSNVDEEDKGQRRRGDEEGAIIMLMEAMKPSENDSIDTKENTH